MLCTLSALPKYVMNMHAYLVELEAELLTRNSFAIQASDARRLIDVHFQITL
jgi:hypothetical protein